MVRFHNHLPSVKIPQAFGIAEMSTHLHNGHTPSESDGNPVNYFNSVNDPNAVNPHGFKDQHYPNVRAGFTARGDMVGDPTESLGSLVVPRPPSRFHRPERLQGHVRLLQPVRRVGHRRRGHGPEPALQGLRHPDLLQRLPVRFELPDRVRPVQPGRHPGRPVPRQRRHPALPERQEAALPVPALRAGPVALVGVVAVGRHQLPAVLADLHRRQPAAERGPGDQRAHGGGRAGRHHRRLRQDQGVAPLLRQPCGADQRPRPDRQDPQPRHAGAAGQPDR